MSTSRRLRAAGALVGVQLVEARFADDVVVGLGLRIGMFPLVQRVPQLLVELVKVQPAAGTHGPLQRLVEGPPSTLTQSMSRTATAVSLACKPAHEARQLFNSNSRPVRLGLTQAPAALDAGQPLSVQRAAPAQTTSSSQPTGVG